MFEYKEIESRKRFVALCYIIYKGRFIISFKLKI